MEPDEDGPLLRIGELSRRLGVSDHVLRAWESRYGLLQPVRSAGGFRLYSGADEQRVRRMQAHLARGLSAAEAARAVLREGGAPGIDPARPAGPVPAASVIGELAAALRQALDAFDEQAAQAVLDRLVSDLSLAAVLRDVVLPYLAELGGRWARGTASIAQEHFASNIIRGRLAGLARGWGGGQGPRAVLACPPGEQHDLGLMIFGIVLNRSGWSIDFLGSSTPVEEVERVVAATHPDLVVLAATRPEFLDPLRAELAALARRAPLALAGAGATAQLARLTGAQLMGGDLVAEAELAAPAERLLRDLLRRRAGPGSGRASGEIWAALRHAGVMDSQRSQSFAPASVPGHYERFMLPQLFEPWARDLVGRAGLRPGAAVLDVASGLGPVARLAAAAAGPEGRVVASDISAAMLARAAARPAGPQSAPVEYLECSALDITAADASFDAVLCQQGLQFFPDRVAALREMHRVTRPGGVVLIATWAAERPLGLFGSISATLEELGVPEPFPGAYDDRSFCLGITEFGDLLETAGFRAVEVTTAELGAVWPTSADAVSAVLGTPFGPSVAALPAAAREQVRAALAARLGQLADGTVTVPTASNIARGLR